jgi:integrase
MTHENYTAKFVDVHSQPGCFLRTLRIDFQEIRRTEERIMQARKALNTRRAYAHAWKHFIAWCEAVERSWLPADPQTVQDFATWCIMQNYRLSTVAIRMSAIGHYHHDAGLETPYDASVRRYLLNAKRDLKEEPAGKAALTYELLRQMAWRFPETPVGIRNKAMILLQFAAGWRRSEVVALRHADVHFVPQGVALWQRSSKVDQTGEGRLVGIERGRRVVTCPVLALERWFDVRGHWDGPLFVRMGPSGAFTRQGLEPRGETLHNALKRMLARIGEDPERFGSHSLRAGMITEAAKHGASESAIKQRTGHKCSETLQKYIRPANIFEFNPLKGVL